MLVGSFCHYFKFLKSKMFAKRQAEMFRTVFFVTGIHSNILKQVWLLSCRANGWTMCSKGLCVSKCLLFLLTMLILLSALVLTLLTACGWKKYRSPQCSAGVPDQNELHRGRLHVLNGLNFCSLELIVLIWTLMQLGSICHGLLFWLCKYMAMSADVSQRWEKCCQIRISF